MQESSFPSNSVKNEYKNYKLVKIYESKNVSHSVFHEIDILIRKKCHVETFFEDF